YTQPALFAIEYALCKLWQSWGINPDVVMGHSIGEYTAACVAGVFSVEDGLKLIAHRGRLMQQLPSGGKMVALMASAEQIREMLTPYNNKVSLAAINGPQSVVISGEGEAITEICQKLENQGIKTKQLRVSHAFHSPLMEPMLTEFTKVAQEITYNSPQISIISNVTGQQADETIATPEYWVRHVREAVRFAQSMETLHQQGYKVFLEIGPKPILLGMGRQCLAEDGEVWLPSLRPNQPDWQQILTSLGKLYVQGAKIDWLGFEKDYNHQRIVLPTYPFQRQRYWLETEQKESQDEVIKQLELENIEQLQKNLEQTGKLSKEEVELLPKILELLAQQQQEKVEKAEIQDWFYEIQWKEQPRKIQPTFKDLEGGKWVIFADKKGLGEQIAEELTGLGYQCDLVFIGENYTHEKEKWYINPSQKEHFQELWEVLKLSSDLPLKGIIHLWGLETTATKDLNLNSLKEAQKITCGSLLYTLQTLTELSLEVAPKLWLVTRGVQPIESEKTSLSVAQSPLWGMGKVVALEFPDWWGGMIDLDIDTSDQEINQLLSEIENSQGEDKIAFRDSKRYVNRLVKSSISENGTLSIYSDKTYFITGGLGALGLKVAQWMVEEGVKYLVLIGRKKPTSEAQSILSQMKKQGVKIEIMSADVSEEKAMKEVFETIESKMPPLKGIIHTAGTLDDGVLLEQNWQRFEKVMSSKVEGTWNLHKLTQDYSLDFCIFFSSVASLLGSLGQSNYAAANQFMDSLAHYLHLQGKPALSINWGPWAEGGMASELQQYQRENIEKQGIYFISVEQGLKALGTLIDSNKGEIGVFSIDWQIFAKSSQKKALPILSDILSSFDGFSYSEGDRSFLKKDWLTQIDSASPEGRLDVFTGYLQQQICLALKLAPDQINLNSSLNMMGMDSLMAMELRNRVKTDLKIDIPVSQIMAGQNTVEIAHYLEEKLSESAVNSQIEKMSETTIEQLTEEALLNNLNELSDAQVVSLLSTMLTEEEEDID
ncbi:MAG: SDR family NAD(P)-dependent oxidoreductase, partial [Crocosphaera sp.]